ncbi:MAG: tripartite tricarboxylate transporter TctB family protein [Alphaproteobacteria bacterium]|nr:MAG: tripartite tricarboxylate transporter TctB family protein [Alphaproteobacteria bacterium]
MSRPSTLRRLFERRRHAGDLVFAVAFLALSLFLASRLGTEAPWVKGMKIMAQPAFWPHVSVIAMVVFAALHLVSGLISRRMPGRLSEVAFWLRSVEFALWFMAYVFVVPWAGYLPTTMVFAVALTLRAGYRDRATLVALALTGAVIVVVFRGFLQVKIPAGALYQYLPDGLRGIALTWL